METLGATGFAFGTTAFALATVALVQVRQLRKELEAMRSTDSRSPGSVR